MVTQRIYKLVYLGFDIISSVSDADTLKVCVGWMVSLDLPQEPGLIGTLSLCDLEEVAEVVAYPNG